MAEGNNKGNERHTGKKSKKGRFSRRPQSNPFSYTTQLSIGIDGRWKAYEFLNIVEIIYYYYNLNLLALILSEYRANLKGNIFSLPSLFVDLENQVKSEIEQSLFEFTELPNSSSLHNFIKYLPEEYQLSTIKLKYNSPGSLDFLGIGEVIKQVKEFLLSLTTLKSEYELKKLEVQEKQEKIREQKIKNLDSTLQIFEKYNIPKEMIKEISNQIKIDGEIVKGLNEENKVKEIQLKSAK